MTHLSKTFKFFREIDVLSEKKTKQNDNSSSQSCLKISLVEALTWWPLDVKTRICREPFNYMEKLVS